MKQFFAFVQKEFYHVFRDRKTLLMLFGLPIAQILLFGFALTNEIKNTRIVVCDYSHDESTRAIIEKIEATEQFIVDKILLSHDEIEEVFKKGKVKMVVVFPSNFRSTLFHENTAHIQLIADASDPNTATTLSNYLTTIIADYQQSLFPVHAIPLQVNPEIRMLYNPELKGSTNFVPGVMALVLMLVCVLMTSVSIVREKETGTMEVLLVSPFSPFMVIVSKAIPYLVLSMVNLGVILLLSVFLMGMTINGSLALLLAVSTLFIITALSLGLLVSNLTNSQQAAMLISLIGMLLPTIMFTGFMFPIENMPLVLQYITHIIPAKWYYIIIKDVMIKGLGMAAIWPETLILIGMTLLLFVVNMRKFKIRLA